MRPSPDEVSARLRVAFPDARITLTDDSHLHAGHAGAAGGAGHFTATVVSARFDGVGRIARHRLVYDAVADWMPGRIHALVVKALTPQEAQQTPASGAAAVSSVTSVSSVASISPLAGIPPSSHLPGN